MYINIFTGAWQHGIRVLRGWSQEKLAAKLQLRGWNITRDSIASLELQRRRVPDCELLFLARTFGVKTDDLFPKSISLQKISSQFQMNRRLALYPGRAK
jgi:transcriptional regulator with XRE-family HTH domain